MRRVCELLPGAEFRTGWRHISCGGRNMAIAGQLDGRVPFRVHRTEAFSGGTYPSRSHKLVLATIYRDQEIRAPGRLHVHLWLMCHRSTETCVLPRRRTPLRDVRTLPR
jgi:hypothetical protein